ncbi:hypothetical protein COO60DRAFT_1627324 [Scenedesmus sp. NREL 46B-D3]|nr:hypothetical protein COO60DRAFT_1627324 [Scenedesmus sp. NREL 46B-D3]
MAAPSSPCAGQKVKSKAIEEVLPSAELLAHYKSRIDQFEQERKELLHAVDRCAVHQDEAHRLEWENRKRADEVRELQKALSDAQQFLFEERQRLLHVQTENDELKLQEIQDRQRIQQLLAMTQPLEQTITHRQDGGAPCSVTVYPKPHPQHTQQQQGSRGGRSPQRGVRAAAGAAAAGGSGERVLRTVFLPTVDCDFLLLKVESLQAQLNEQRQLHEERVAALLADRQLRAQEEERQRANWPLSVCKQQACVRLATLVLGVLNPCGTGAMGGVADKAARREKQDAQAAAAAAQAQMVSDVAAARAELAAVQRQARAEVDKASAAADSRMREYVDKFRDQVRWREEELMRLGSLHTTTKAAADKRIAELEGRVSRLLDANRQLELRRQLDVDGWAADVTALRKTLGAVDRKLLQMRLIDRLEDDERLDALLDQLEKRVPAPGAATSAANRKQPTPAAGQRPAGTAAGSSKQPGARPKQQSQQQQQREPGWRLGGQAGSRPASRDERSAHAAGRLAAAAAASEGGGCDGVGDGDESDTGVSSSTGTVPGSVKSGLAAELRGVRQQLEQLEVRASSKARRALAGLPACIRGDVSSRAAGGQATQA